MVFGGSDWRVGFNSNSESNSSSNRSIYRIAIEMVMV